MAGMRATMRAEGQGNAAKFKVIDPRAVDAGGKGVQVYDAKQATEAIAEMDAINAAIDVAEAAAEAKGGPKLVVKLGKATLTGSGLGYKGQIMGGYVADFEAIIAFFGASPDSEGVKAFNAAKSRMHATWQEYGDLAVGAITKSGEPKPQGKGK